MPRKILFPPVNIFDFKCMANFRISYSNFLNSHFIYRFGDERILYEIKLKTDCIWVINSFFCYLTANS